MNVQVYINNVHTRINKYRAKKKFYYYKNFVNPFYIWSKKILTMKEKITLILILLISSCNSGEPIIPETKLECNMLEIVDGLVYLNDNKFTGSCVTFYVDSSNRDEIRSYKNGLRDGTWAKFYQNSNLRYKGVAKKGEITGKYRSYFDNGSLEDSGYMYKGFKDGVWFKFDIYNQLRRKTQFDKGEIKNDKIYDEYVY